MWIVCGYPERDGGRLYNAALVIGPDGALVGSYRKILLFDVDKCWAHPGRERLVVETDFGPVMPGICMDINDPRFVESLHLNAPQVLAFCTNWVNEGDDPLDYWRMRLAFWRGWFVAANSWGEDGDIGFTGLSTILGPDGQVRARAPATGDALLLSD
jgi:predicted amidohydrolase